MFGIKSIPLVNNPQITNITQLDTQLNPMMVTSYHFNVSNFTWKPFMFLSCITFFLWTLQAAQSEDEEEGEKIYYKGKFYSLSSNQPEIKVARDTWEEIISSRYKDQGNEDGSLSDSLNDILQDKGLSQDVLDIFDYWKLKISAGSLTHYGVREGRRRMESKFEWGLGNCRWAQYFVGRTVWPDSMFSDKLMVVLCKVVLTLILNSSMNS